MKNLAIIVLIVAFTSCKAQTNTLKFEDGMTSPKADLSQVSWMEGHWKGEAFGGITEEIWSPPLGDSMMFSFKLVSDGKVVFYELGGIREVDDTLIFQLKHFGNDFKGWEEKDETVDAKLIKIEDNRAYFDQFTFEKISDTEINIYVVIEEEGTTEEVKFNYKKQ
ncbi:DUF6265 family protein [Olleya sp. R77988]|uniref:DUF6265 family protein n=1 Tax=Olleya sp. R77988 TaxID=3093875 RepID=UPI0037C74B35